ncbi:uncharacterized protein LOC125956949 [Anopheles darlingi]|uniref:uncharacterized protein LOC125956949 n=1 Tax=Anopheles darlingi TaxID=43151 RepID=UPI0021000E58|nr:uncharacterized protein LOC125956949 [Anopheles darlingi]
MFSAGAVSGVRARKPLSAGTTSSTAAAAVAILPPNVNSKPHGKLTVRFGEFHDSSGSGLRWNSAKVYVSVDLQLFWWGQPTTASGTTSTTLHWEQGNNRQNRASETVYEVRTNPELFRRYLKSCEPVRVRLISTRTQTLIGTAQVAIPGKFTNLRESGDHPVTALARGEVLSVRGFCLGELCLELTLHFDRKGADSATTVTSRSTAEEEKENTKMLLVESNPIRGPVMPALAVEGKPAPLHESSQRTQATAERVNAKKRFHTLDPTARQKILDYLTGRPIDGDDGCSSELSALSEICSISPAESMLEALARYDRTVEPDKHSYLRTVDCVRVLVESLKFTRAGQKEIQHRARRQELAMYGASFVVRMKLTEAGSKTATVPPPITRLKFCSTAASETEVTFDVQPQLARLCLPELSNGRHGEACFEFAVHLNVGSFYKARLFYLGSAQITLQELITGRLACYKRCPIRLASDDILLGTLTVRLELGKRGLHFGPDLIDAVLVDGGNVTLEEDEGEEESEAGEERSVTPEAANSPCAAPALLHCARRHRSPVCFDRCHHEKASAIDHFSCRMMMCKAAVAACPGDNQSPPETRDGSAGDQHSSVNGANQENSQATRNGAEQGNASDGQGSGEQQQQPKPMETDGSSPGGEQPKLLHGLLYLGQLKERAQPPEQHFLVCHPFWSEEPSTLTSELCQPEGDFNYLRTFPVLPNNEFLERVRNQHMRVELWQKAPGEGEKLVGLARLPLHQFYIAFRDAQLSEHLAHARLPVISIDGWTSISSPLAAEPCGQLQAVLAIGTESQIDLFRTSRQLPLHTSGDVPRTYPRSVINPSIDGNGYTTRSLQGHKSIPSSCGGGCAKQPQTSEVANMLSAFIENLAQRLPISSERSTAPSFDNNNSLSAGTGGPEPPLSGSPHSQANRPQLRKTADLLDNLQKALAQRPSAATLDGMGMLAGLAAGRPTSLLGATTPADQTPPAAGTDETLAVNTAVPQPPSLSTHPPSTVVEHRTGQVTDEHSEPASSSEVSAGTDTEEHKLIRLSIEIERAVNLPKLTISKKYAKRHKARPSHSVPEALLLEPSAYATFEGHNLKLGSPNTVKSHEGIVYTTHVIERSCSPGWQKRFEVQLPSDLMTNDEKRFIVKVWRKAALSDAPKCRLLPAPMEDAVIGFCAIDLALLLSGLSSILGWYNIMDFSGRCNGQIKICIKPLEDVQPFKVTGEQQQLSNFRLPLSIDVDCEPSALGLDASCNTSLSRALKRKFTELEEITERLKARLFDVTGDDNDDGGEDDDGAIDPDDEFERDLNTVATEDDDEEEDDDESVDGCGGGGAGGRLPWSVGTGDGDQLGDTSNRKRNSQYPNGAMTRTTNTSSYSMCATDRSSLTGCSNRDSPRQATSSSIGKRAATATSQMQLEQLLQSHDIETLINPAILKNLLQPSIDSESTPELGVGEEEDAGTGPGTDADMQSDDSSSVRSPLGTVRNDSSAPTVGTDRVKQIAKALQRTTITDASRSSGDDGNVTMQETSGDDARRVDDRTSAAAATATRRREAPEGEPMKDVSK